jgi:hypothetical protein
MAIRVEIIEGSWNIVEKDLALFKKADDGILAQELGTTIVGDIRLPSETKLANSRA